jgi:hypothetical protein
MIEIKTESGFTCKLPKECLNNMELVDAMTEDALNEAFRTAKVAKLLLGEQKAALYDHVRIQGRVPVDAVEREIRDILLAFGQQGKNS